MNTYRSFVGLIAAMAMVVSLVPVNTAHAATGTISAYCSNGDVHLSWGSHPDANQNTLQRTDSYPYNEDWYWTTIYSGSTRSYTDRDVNPNTTYWYRVKYRSGITSNVITVNCPGDYYPYPTWTPYPTELSCSPSYQSVESGDRVTFTAHQDYYQYDYPYYQLTWSAPHGDPSNGTGTSFSTRFYENRDVTRTVTVSNGYRTATCTVYVSDEDDGRDLEISPTSRTIDSGDSITFEATGGNGSYYWYTSEADASGQWGSSQYTVRFYNYSNSTQTRYVTVRSGNQSRTATVKIRPDDRYDEDLRISPTTKTVDHGEYVTFRATGGTGYYSWESDYGYGGSGDWYQVRFENYSRNNVVKYVTVRSGNKSETARITVRPYDDDYYPYPTYTPYPTPYPYPTYTPYPVADPYSQLTVSQVSRNITTGQTGWANAVQAKDNETVQFTITVRNTSSETLHNVRLTDILPSGLRYVWGSTTIDNEQTNDGITSSGLYLGTMYPNRVIAIRVSAEVMPGSVPSRGSVTVYNTAQVRADNAGAAVSQLPVTLGTRSTAAVISTASGVKTGAGGSVVLAALAGLAASVLYGMYTRSGMFNRRYELARIRTHMRDRQRLNFARLLS